MHHTLKWKTFTFIYGIYVKTYISFHWWWNGSGKVFFTTEMTDHVIKEAALGYWWTSLVHPNLLKDSKYQVLLIIFSAWLKLEYYTWFVNSERNEDLPVSENYLSSGCQKNFPFCLQDCGWSGYASDSKPGEALLPGSIWQCLEIFLSQL